MHNKHSLISPAQFVDALLEEFSPEIVEDFLENDFDSFLEEALSEQRADNNPGLFSRMRSWRQNKTNVANPANPQRKEPRLSMPSPITTPTPSNNRTLDSGSASPSTTMHFSTRRSVQGPREPETKNPVMRKATLRSTLKKMNNPRSKMSPANEALLSRIMNVLTEARKPTASLPKTKPLPKAKPLKPTLKKTAAPAPLKPLKAKATAPKAKPSGQKKPPVKKAASVAAPSPKKKAGSTTKKTTFAISIERSSGSGSTPSVQKRKSPKKKPGLIKKVMNFVTGGNNKRKAAAKKAVQTRDLRNTFGVAPGKRYKNKPITANSKRTTTLVKSDMDVFGNVISERYHVIHSRYSLEPGKVGQRSGPDEILSQHHSLHAAGRKLGSIIHKGTSGYRSTLAPGKHFVKDNLTGKTYTRNQCRPGANKPRGPQGDLFGEDTLLEWGGGHGSGANTVMQAFLAGKSRKIKNDSTDGKEWRYHGNVIARHGNPHTGEDDGSVHGRLAGWNTVTTRARLSTLHHHLGNPGWGFGTKRGQAYHNGEKIGDNEWRQLRAPKVQAPKVDKHGQHDMFGESRTGTLLKRMKVARTADGDNYGHRKSWEGKSDTRAGHLQRRIAGEYLNTRKQGKLKFSEGRLLEKILGKVSDKETADVKNNEKRLAGKKDPNPKHIVDTSDIESHGHRGFGAKGAPIKPKVKGKK